MSDFKNLQLPFIFQTFDPISLSGKKMTYIFLFLAFFSTELLSAEIRCASEVTTVSELDECLKDHHLKPTSSTKEILEWKKRLKISAPLVIEVEKVQLIVAETCGENESPKSFATKLSKEVENILAMGSLQIENWKVPNFPATGAKNYSMKASKGCRVQDLLNQMKYDVDSLVPDLMNVYNLGLALDTTSSQENNMRILANNIDEIYSSIPGKANISFVVTSYGDNFRQGLKFEGDKNYVLSRVKQFILSQKIHGGGAPPEFVYGGSYITSKNLGRAHGLIFNWTNATGDNTQAHTNNGMMSYSLNGLSGFAKQNVHIIRNVFLRCGQ